jgi:hypothetical protein
VPPGGGTDLEKRNGTVVVLYFLGFVAAFSALVLGMVWYSRFMFQRIYGDIREQIDCIAGGSTPPEWDERLVRRIARCRSEKEKAAAVEKHKRFVKRRVMDFILFMKRTSFVRSEAEREIILKQLELFRI